MSCRDVPNKHSLQDDAMKAMRILSACYKYGRGTKVDAVKGEYWMAEAAKNKEKNALELMKDK